MNVEYKNKRSQRINQAYNILKNDTNFQVLLETWSERLDQLKNDLLVSVPDVNQLYHLQGKACAYRDILKEVEGSSETLNKFRR